MDFANTEPLRTISHELRNALTPVLTFLQVVEVDKKNEKLQELHRISIENINQILTLLKKLKNK